MKLEYFLTVGVLAVQVLAEGTIPLRAQTNIPGTAGPEMVRNLRPSGRPVIPLFDGWHPNADGSYGLCFGYFNLNLEQVLDIPLGPDNFIEPTRFDGGQPTHFRPVPTRLEGYDRRYYCVFSVKLPPGADSERVVWTLRIDGESYSVPGHIQAPSYKIEEPDQPGRNSVAPLVRFLDPAGPEVTGRSRSGDLMAGPVTTQVGDPLSLRISVSAPMTGNPHSGFERVRALWVKHRGPGNVTFSPPDQMSIPDGMEVLTRGTFSEPGDYVLRVQAYEGRSPWGAQCCWTNAYIKVTVTP